MTFLETITGKFPSSPSSETPRRHLAWGLFGRFLAMQSGVLFFVAAAICFFAYNWAKFSAFSKFGMIVFLMALSLLPALTRGFSSSLSQAGLLLCGLLGGVLFAVYGQVYQTGADAWELFRSWAFWLFPLFLISRRAGLFFALWGVVTLWAVSYWELWTLASELPRAFWYIQTLVWVVFEMAAWFCPPGISLPFLRARWVPRCIGIFSLTALTIIVCIDHASWRMMGHQFLWEAEHTGILLLFLWALGGGGVWYTRVRHDLLMVAAGLLSLIAFLSTVILCGFKGFTLESLLFLSLMLLGLSVVAGKLLIHLHRRFKADDEKNKGEKEDATLDAPAEETLPVRDEKTPLLSLPSLLSLRVMGMVLREKIAGEKDAPPSPEARESSPWVVRFLLGACAWVVVPLLISVLVLMLERMGVRSPSSAMCASAIFLAGAIALSSQTGVFMRQAVFCVSLAAALVLSVSATIEWLGEEHFLVFIPSLVVVTLSVMLTRNEAYRFVASVVLVPLAASQIILLYWHFFWGLEDLSFSYSRQEIFFGAALADRVYFPFMVCLFSLLGAALAAVWENPRALFPKPLRCLNANGLLVAFMIVGLIFVFMRGFHYRLPVVFLKPIKACGIGAGIGFLVLMFRLSVELSLSRPLRAASIFLGLAVACVGSRFPWLSAGLFALALARYKAFFPLFGLSVIYTAFCTVMEYYNQTTTLLDKSRSLAWIALGLALTAWALQTGLSWALKKNGLSIPDDLAPFCHSGRWKSVRGERKLRGVLGGIFALFVGLFVHSVASKETLLTDGAPVLLEIQPRDPRSLMQGDYMTLRFSLEDVIAGALPENAAQRETGRAVIEPDANGVYHFVALYDPAVPLTEKQIRLIYRVKGGARRGSVQVSSGAFFFEEGTGEALDAARYAELRVDESGQSLIVGLRDRYLAVIHPESKTDHKEPQ